MKNRIRTNSFRNIKKAFPRFLSLIIMSGLGVFAFAGLQATAPDMIVTLDNSLDRGNVYDIRVISDMGLTEEDVSAVASLDGVKEAEGVCSADAIVVCDEEDKVVHVESLPEKINQAELTSGRMPQQNGEIVVEDRMLSETSLELGDVIEFEDEDSFSENRMTIVGTVDSPMYFNNASFHGNRGITSVGSGSINYYAYAPTDSFTQDYLSVLYVTVDGAAEEITSYDSYVTLVQKVEDELEELAPSREEVRYEKIQADGSEEIDDARADADEELADAKSELDDAKQQLTDGRDELNDALQKIADAEQELADGKSELDSSWSELMKNQAKLKSAEKALEEGKAEYHAALAAAGVDEDELDTLKATLEEGIRQGEDGLAQIEDGLQQVSAGLSQVEENQTKLTAGLTAADQGLTEIEEGLKTVDAGLAQIDAELAQIDAELEAAEASAEESASQRSSLEAKKAELQATKAELQAKQQELQATRAELEAQQGLLDETRAGLEEKKAELEAQQASVTEQIGTAQTQLTGIKQLIAARDRLTSSEKELEEGRGKLEDAFAAYDEGKEQYNNGASELADAKKIYRENEDKYEENLQKYKDGLEDYQQAQKDADQEIADARQELAEVDHPTWYIYDRTDNSTYQDYIDDSNSISNLSKIFPVVFFLVAVLVSLISMNRMVEDDRLEIGTLKSLGFETSQIMGKYVLFAALATVIGGIIGAALGLYIIPNLINGIYKILFDVPDFVLLPRWGTTLTGFAITVVCVCGTCIFTAWQVLREKPSELMRPKAPKGGKRVFLENIPALWHRLKFSQKVTVRNLFRYKKRVMVTVGGIAGCTALMLTGFGIRDAIQDIAAVQYETIWQFDGTAYVSSLTSGSEDGSDETSIFDIPDVTGYTPTQRVTVESGDLSAYLCVVEDDEALTQIASLKDAETEELLHLQPGEVIITEKFSALTGLEAGDTVNVVDTDHNSYSWKISGVATNYIEHYIFMDEDTYGQYSDWEPNIVYFNTRELTDDEQEQVSEELLANDDVLMVSFKDNLIDSVNDTLQSLNRVVLILIVLASLLSFVVLYNLSNINISERRREIASLKVLGFYDKEVDNYITRENIILTFLGIVIGLFIGRFLSHLVVAEVEVEKCRFINVLQLRSYLYSAAMAVLFTWIVNVITHFNLRRINMVDSLKSVE